MLTFGVFRGAGHCFKDNDHPKGHHRHIGASEEPYLFSTMRQLVGDFMTGARTIAEGNQMKTVSFSIRPIDDVMDDVVETFEAARTGRRIPKGPREEVGFTSIEAARNFLTRERLTLLRTIRTRHPSSLYELAKI